LRASISHSFAKSANEWGTRPYPRLGFPTFENREGLIG
jgi:hypothetical protein